MQIRKARPEDLGIILKIYEDARIFMAQHGNPRQWGNANWPPRTLIENDILLGKSYVCEEEGRVIAVFYYDFGKDIEKTYDVIREGQWKDDSPYGVVHRIATDHSKKGIGSFCINWAFSQCNHLRIDTHPDNTVMQGMLRKLGFDYCGIIDIVEDNDPRLAFEKI